MEQEIPFVFVFRFYMPLMTELSSSERFMKLLTLHQGQVFGYIFALAHDLEDAKDIFQQTSLVLWRKFDAFDGTNFPAWACRTAQFEAMNYLRSKRRGQASFSDALLVDLTTRAAEAGELAQSRRHALEGCLEKLAPDDRQLIDQCYGNARGVTEVAESLGRSLQSVCNSLRRVRRMLFDCINRTIAREDRS
jgi:RNA polymerase sigma-70 factor (ECF subfamily)